MLDAPPSFPVETLNCDFSTALSAIFYLIEDALVAQTSYSSISDGLTIIDTNLPS